MKNAIMIIAFALFAGTYTANAQDGKPTAKKETCCTATKACKTDAKCTPAEKAACIADKRCSDEPSGISKKKTK